MRMLAAVFALALSALTGVTAAHAAYFSFNTDRSERRYYDPHFDQVPVWAQRAFTPGNRR